MKHLLLVFCHSVAFVFIFVLTSIGAYAQTSPVTVTITKVKAFIDEADEGLESLGEDTADLYAKVFINGVERSSFNVHQDDN